LTKHWDVRKGLRRGNDRNVGGVREGVEGEIHLDSKRIDRLGIAGPGIERAARDAGVRQEGRGATDFSAQPLQNRGLVIAEGDIDLLDLYSHGADQNEGRE
jgi:hypothetical protein